MSRSLRLAIVGYGKIARDQHRAAIEATEGIDLVAVASRNAAPEGIASYPDLASLLAEGPPVDAVALCQPPQVRFQAARDALLAGKHVFLEKPPGATLSEVAALTRLASEQGVTLFASWHSREAAGVRAAQQWLSARVVREARITWKEDVRHWHPGQQWLWEPGGFGVFDPGINALSIATLILADPLRVTAADLHFPSNRDAPIAASLTMELTTGVRVSAEFDFRQTGPQTWDIIIATDNGALRLSEGGNRLFIDGTEQVLADEGEYRALYRHFVDLAGRGASDVDVAPLRIAADAFLLGRRLLADPFTD